MKFWPSPAKLNLFLYITGRRPEDQYHNLQTLFQFLDYSDYLSFAIRSDNQVNLLTPIENVPNEKNLIVKAAKLLQEHIQQQYGDTHTLQPVLGVDISIEKNLPMGGGLGGASSNAATVLVALNHLWQLGLTPTQLMTLGSSLGADVPIFIYGHAAFAEGIGDKFHYIDVPEKWFLVARPNVEISTVKIFTDPDLKRDAVTRTLTELLNTPFINDCEPLVCKRYPQVTEVIKLLSQYAPTRLTGTGSCVFAEFNDYASAKQTQEKLPRDIYTFIAKGTNISPLSHFTQNKIEVK